jgi:hypothetical protein
LQIDDNFKRLVKELGNAINESLGDSEKISEVMGRIRTAGYDIFLVLEVTIGFNKRDEADMSPEEKLAAEKISAEFHLTNQDTQFLRALKISVEKDRD